MDFDAIGQISHRPRDGSKEQKRKIEKERKNCTPSEVCDIGHLFPA